MGGGTINRFARHRSKRFTSQRLALERSADYRFRGSFMLRRAA
jgi:hypothetical protein